MSKQTMTIDTVQWFGTKSRTRREIILTTFGTAEKLTLPVEVTTKTGEIKGQLCVLLGLEPEELSFVVKQSSSHKVLLDSDEIRSCTVRGIDTWTRKKARHPHPIGVIGAGHMGLRQALSFIKEGIDDFVVVDRWEIVGGTAWVKNANRTSKLQTELGVYHLNYGVGYTIPRETMKTWPSRDELLAHFQLVCEEYGIMAHLRMQLEVRSIDVVISQPDKPAHSTDRQHLNVMAVPPNNGEDDDQGKVDWRFSALAVYPGGLTMPLRVECVGEELFEGQIGYGMFEEFDYTRVPGQSVAIWGMGAFGVENVRTCLEHGATKCWLICRRKNITMPRVLSWFINQSVYPPPGAMLLDAMRPMYDLIPEDPWAYYSIVCNKDRTAATIRQKARFGIGDVYFLASYYGKVETVVDSIKRLVPREIVMDSGLRIEVEHFIKVLGFKADMSLDKLAGIREMVGFFANGDWRRWVFTESPGVDAGRFGGTSLSPGAISTVETYSYFLNYPKDAAALLETQVLPRHKADKDKGMPAYQWDVRQSASIGMIMSSGVVPGLAELGGSYADLNRMKEREAHPLEKFVDEVAEEWYGYCKMFREADDTRPVLEYPYSYEFVRDLVERNDRQGEEEMIRQAERSAA